MLGEPEENSGYEKDDSGDHHGPEPNLLPAVELANILRFWLVGLGGVVLGMAQPLPVRRLPTHLIRPSAQLEDDSNYKSDSKPGMQQTRARAAAEDRRKPGVKPGSKQREARK